MVENIIVLLALFWPFIFLAITMVIGRVMEKSHYKDIKAREQMFFGKPSVTFKNISDLGQEVESSVLCVGSVVVSVDHFKRFLFGFRKIFGGECHSYSSIIDRGRREALLRMKEDQPGADMYMNCRLETSTISNGAGKAVGCMEITAYSTAVKFKKEIAV